MGFYIEIARPDSVLIFELMQRLSPAQADLLGFFLDIPSTLLFK